ncbi:MAG: 16S rRNA (cytidine(1402)-2'-O)-methyltransferase [Desulfarculus sp.]|nr:16S rRNA (cytidine(1402)-2'-O)-methyltransferase [Desulfarculus sp.]
MSTLYVVATPIGNLEDLTPRAARILGEVPVVAAESLARGKKLLSHLGLKGKRVISCREANRRRAAAQVVQALEEGHDVALISDAGTPGVSDPGVAVVQAVAASGHRLCPVAGPSALAASLSVAGLPGAPLVFLGFAPAKPGARKKLLERAASTGWTFALFEAPHRLAETAAGLVEVVGGERPVVMARELTKLHEEVVHTTCQELAELARSNQARGEITLVVAGGPSQEVEQEQAGQVGRLLAQGMQEGQPPSRLAKQVAQQTGQPREAVYRRLLELKQARPEQGSATRTEPVESSGAIKCDDDVLQCQLEVNNSLGLHARVAARIAETVQRYDCQVVLCKDGLEADGASVLSILALDAPLGSLITVQAKGKAARQALQALEGLFAGSFGEN